MGNYQSHGRSGNPTGNIILSNGEVREFIQPLTAAELMLDHPQQVVVELGLDESGTRLTPLPADKKLETKKVYVMLPMKRGKVVPLTTDEARRLMMMVKPIWGQRTAASSLPRIKILPLFAQMCTRMGLGLGNHHHHHPHHIVLNGEDDLMKKEVSSDEFLYERPQAFSRQFSGRGWKPSLDTIKEKTVQKKISHWLF